MKYGLSEIQGKHHKIFVDSNYARSREYAEFWENLRNGNYHSGVYHRFDKFGKDIWIQASYNPVFDADGKVYKVIKYASDMTDLIQAASLAEQTNADTQTVAAAVEEMSASIGDINKNMELSDTAVNQIIDKTNSSKEIAEKLVDRMQAMRGIIETIGAIASQVNLLALNASIEAARAGDAGKGFAVVANEVKNLAAQTTEATEVITSEISQAAEVSESVSMNVTNIAGDVNKIGEYISTSTNSMRDQSIVVDDIANKTQSASIAVSNIAEQIKELTRAN